ncbi:MAG: hypothetical protein K6G70_02540 [Bacteroidaceae bacterium]|nr:hypothetical protein [Bacteroidaceae bacterium]
MTRIMEATTARRRRVVQPITRAWNLAKKLDDNEKLELVTMLIDSVKPIHKRTLIDMPLEEEFADMDKELYTPEEAYEMTMKDIKAIYEDATV